MARIHRDSNFYEKIIAWALLWIAAWPLLSHPEQALASWRSGVETFIGILVMASFLTFARRPKAGNLTAKAWLGLILSIGGYFFYEVVPPKHGEFAYIVYSVSTGVYIFFVSVCYAVMRRNFGVTPALRGVVTAGPFSIVRHPIYSTYVHVALAYTAIAMSPRNVLVTAAVILGYILRAREEESVLCADATYQAQMKRVPYRFFDPVVTAPLAVLFFVLALGG